MASGLRRWMRRVAWMTASPAERRRFRRLELGRLQVASCPAPLLAPETTDSERVSKLAAEPRAPQGGVLMIEDSPELLALAEEQFVRAGYRFLGAGDAEGGLRLALEHGPELIFVDFGLPGTKGYELIKQLRQSDATARTPLIMMSGHPHGHSVADMLRWDICQFLQKPVPMARLLRSAEEALGRGAAEAAPAPEPERPRAPAAPIEIERFARDEGAPVPPASLEQLAREAYGELRESAGAGFGPLGVEIEGRVARLVSRVLADALERRASDVHLEPQEDGLRLRLRVDGRLEVEAKLPAALGSALATRIKVMASLNIAERRAPQDGRFEFGAGDGKVEFRVSVLPCRYGEKIVLRALGRAKISGALSTFASGRELERLEAALACPHGLIAVTGPTGSGKTTTLYTMLARLNSEDRNIVTIENPIEYELPGITQVGVHPEAGLTFEKALRAFLRQDPDVILVGEIRDRETAEIALKAAGTGHLVLTTLHTNDAAGVFARLAGMGVPPYAVEGAMRLAVAQRLLRRLCACRLAVPVESLPERRLLCDEEAARLTTVWQPVGCASCSGSGYRGRVPALELLVVSPAIRELIAAGARSDALRRTAVEEGMVPLRQAALALVESGISSLEEALRATAAD